MVVSQFEVRNEDLKTRVKLAHYPGVQGKSIRSPPGLDRRELYRSAKSAIPPAIRALL